MAFDWLSSAIDGVLGLFGLGNSAWNRHSQEKMNQQNLDYAKAMTEKQWERDDTTYQRSVADATAAGFSPLAVLDGGLSPNGSPVGYQGVAPQFDINSALQAFSQASNKLFESNENFKNRSHELQKIKTEYTNALDLAEKELKNDKEKVTWEQEESLRILKEINKEEISKQKQLTQIEKLKELGVVSTRICSDEKEASQLYSAWCDKYTSYVENYKNYSVSNVESDKENAKTNVPVVNASAEVTSTTTTTSSQALSFSEYMETFFYENPMPLNPDGTIPYFIRSKSDRKTY